LIALHSIVRRIVDVFVGKLEGRVSAEELRRGLGIRPEDLAEDLDATDAEAPEAREKPPLWGQGAVEEAVGGVCEAAEVGMTSAMTVLRPRHLG